MNEYIVGADEVGYGSWAGPLVVCGVKADKDWTYPGLNDSKKLSAKKREALSDVLTRLDTITYVLVSKTNVEIDTLGLGVCLKAAYQEVADKLLTDDATMVMDGVIKLPKPDARIVSIIKADTTVATVMAASIIAKVYRDNLMHKLAAQYPMYGWESNVGYGATVHKEGIKKHGLCDLHRKSYRIKL